MKLRVTLQPEIECEAEISIDHPASIPGPLSLRRKDTGEFIAMRDIFGLPGTSFKKYDLLALSADEQLRLHEAGIMVF